MAQAEWITGFTKGVLVAVSITQGTIGSVLSVDSS